MRSSPLEMDLFAEKKHELVKDAWLLRSFAQAFDGSIATALKTISATSPFRKMKTPNGYSMSVAMTNCGDMGWVSDNTGYRYQSVDPETKEHWPAMPDMFRELAQNAAAEANFLDFVPNACLINQYYPGAKMALHQDKDERYFGAPIVSVSLGLPATFLFGGRNRSDPVARISLNHGDVIVWGGSARMNYHGVAPVKSGVHPMFNGTRINLTFRKALL